MSLTHASKREDKYPRARLRLQTRLAGSDRSDPYCWDLKDRVREEGLERVA
jgi:hypothetical protein